MRCIPSPMGNRNVIGEGIFCLARRALAAVKLYGSQTGLLDKFTHVGKRQEVGFSEEAIFLIASQTIVAYPGVIAGRGSGVVR